MSALFDVLERFFQEDDWSYTADPETGTLHMGFAGENGRWPLVAGVREVQEQVVIYSIAPVDAPPERRLAVAEFITRANEGMIVGNFEMRWDLGEVRYKTSIDVEGSQLDTALVKNLVYANCLMMDRYLPGLMQLLNGDTTPEQAIELVENPSEAIN